MENKKIREKYLQLKNLTQYKNMDEDELMKLSEEKLLEADRELEIASLFTDKSEITTAKKLLGKYLKDYTPDSVSDKNNLRHLIYLEMIQVRLQTKMNEMNTNSNAIPLQMIDSIHKNLREINDLKFKLGLVGEKRSELKSDVYRSWELLKDKFKRWRAENQGTRTVVCPYCGKMVMLKIRTEVWEAQKHPYFKDRILANKHLVRLYNEGRVNRTDVAAILECSENYVDWLIEKWAKINEPTKEASVAESEAFSESSENDSSTSSSRFSDSSSSESLIPKETLINVDKKVDVESSSSL